MIRRLTIGLRFKPQEQWTGGVHYVQNLVSALDLWGGLTRPRLVIVGEDPDALSKLASATGYRRLSQISRSRIRRAPSARGLSLFRPGVGEIDLMLMGSPPGMEERGIQWFPDLQERRFPEFFAPEELNARHRRNTTWLSLHRHVMVSSEDVAGDLARYYGTDANHVHVVRFASFAKVGIGPADRQALRQVHGLPERYFICNNQFWRHKNHGLILDALSVLPADEPAPPVVFTGLEVDYRDPAYGPSIRERASAQGLDERVRFLGFIPRSDQLALMQGAIAVIQPSLCEGWSTVIEDAKAMGRSVLASDIAVHREQITRNVDFFGTQDPVRLAELLRRYRDAEPAVEPIDYDAARRRFASDLKRMIVEVLGDLRRRKIDRLEILKAREPSAAR